MEAKFCQKLAIGEPRWEFLDQVTVGSFITCFIQKIILGAET